MSKFYAALIGLLIGLYGSSHAQVYKSIDADGNVVFSDTPTRNSEEVNVPKANVADSVEVPESAPGESMPEPKKQEIAPQPEVVVVVEDDDDDDDLSRREKRREAKRREERRDHRRR